MLHDQFAYSIRNVGDSSIIIKIMFLFSETSSLFPGENSILNSRFPIWSQTFGPRSDVRVHTAKLRKMHKGGKCFDTAIFLHQLEHNLAIIEFPINLH